MAGAAQRCRRSRRGSRCTRRGRRRSWSCSRPSRRCWTRAAWGRARCLPLPHAPRCAPPPHPRMPWTLCGLGRGPGGRPCCHTSCHSASRPHTFLYWSTAFMVMSLKAALGMCGMSHRALAATHRVNLPALHIVLLKVVEAASVDSVLDISTKGGPAGLHHSLLPHHMIPCSGYLRFSVSCNSSLCFPQVFAALHCQLPVIQQAGARWSWLIA